jgi:transcriptional regulator with XRE-family HTH domain
MTPAQSRAARGLLDWSQTELAEGSNLSESTIRDFEKGRRTPTETNISAIQRVFEDAGVEFLDDGQHSVRMRKMRQGDYVTLREGNPLRSQYGNAIGVILRELSEAKLGGVERVDVQFPGHKPLAGVKTTALEIYSPRHAETVSAVCDKCGLRVSVKPTETHIEHIRYITICKRASDRPAFDYGCPDLRRAVSTAHQQLRKVRS